MCTVLLSLFVLFCFVLFVRVPSVSYVGWLVVSFFVCLFLFCFCVCCLFFVFCWGVLLFGGGRGLGCLFLLFCGAGVVRGVGGGGGGPVSNKTHEAQTSCTLRVQPQTNPLPFKPLHAVIKVSVAPTDQ